MSRSVAAIGRCASAPASPQGLRLMACAILLGLGSLLVGQGLWIHAKAMLAQVLLERAFSASLHSGKPEKPWSWFDSWPEARISVPRLAASAVALADASGQALAFGPGHVAGTPVAGEPGTAVYAAHRDTHFAFLREVVTGDLVEVTRRDGKAFIYRVTGSEVVRWDASQIDALAPGRHLVLATCWPFDAITHGPERLLVRAELVEPASSR
jgi:sortase A